MNDAIQRRTKEYDEELGDGERLLLFVLLSFPHEVPVSDLEALYRLAAQEHGLPANEEGFLAALSTVRDSFVRVEDKSPPWEEEPATASLLESATDLIETRLLAEPQEIAAMLARAQFFAQVKRLYELAVANDAMPLAHLLESLQSAFARTLECPDPFVQAWEHVDEIEVWEVLGRLRTLTEWCERAAGLRDFLTASLAEATPGLLERSLHEDVNIDMLSNWLELLTKLDAGGFEIDSLAASVRDCAISRAEKLLPFEVLVALRKLRPSLLEEREWSVLKQDFAAWTEECLEVDGADELDREELELYDHENRYWFLYHKLKRLEALAAEMGLTLDPSSLEDAWIHARSNYRGQQEHCDDFDGTYPLLEELA